MSTSTAEIVELPDGRSALVRYFPPDREPIVSLPNAPIPVYIGPPLLGLRLELELRRIGVYDAQKNSVSVRPAGTVVCGVCVAIHRSNGVIVLAPAGARREDGSWSTTRGLRVPYVREEIVRLSILDLDAVPL